MDAAKNSPLTQANPNISTIPPEVHKFRLELRGIIPPYYSSKLHYLGTTCVSLPIAIYALIKLSAPSLLELLTIPVAFIFASLVEYIAHKFPLHRPIKPLTKAYLEHTIRHHHFYTHDAIEFEEPRDFFQVFFPVWGVALIQYGVGLPASLLVGELISPNSGYLFMIVGSMFFFIYETIHMICHLKTTHWAFKIPGLLFIREHHRIHHHKGKMGRYNFNIVLPIWDFFLGTMITSIDKGQTDRTYYS